MTRCVPQGGRVRRALRGSSPLLPLRTIESVRLSQARLLARLDHAHIICHHATFITPHDDVLHIVMDLASGGTLHDAVRAAAAMRVGAPPVLPERTIWRYGIHLLLALRYIHRHRIVHRDIKSLNVFLLPASHDHHSAGAAAAAAAAVGEFDVAIGDFGIARALGDGTALLRTIAGTPFYLSPELCADRPYDYKTDIWALGICLVRSHPDQSLHGTTVIALVRPPEPANRGRRL